MVRKAVLAGLVSATALLALGAQAAVAQEPQAEPPPVTTGIEAPPETQQPDTDLVPVDAMVDSETPIEDARIRVLDHDGRPLEQVDPNASDRTNDNGVAVLEFTDLPSRFTVEVGGGQVNGDRFEGTLRTDVEGYDRPDGDVVVVDPVSTIAAADGVTVGEAKRLLGIPNWFTDTDFLFSNPYFDADAFLRAADRAHGVDALIDGLVDEQRADPSAREPFRATDATKATAAKSGFSDWAALALKAATGNWQPLAKEMFTTLLDTAASKVGSKLPQGGPVLGWVMKQIGLGGKEEDKDMEALKEALGDIGKAIAGLHQQGNSILAAIEKTNFNNLYQATREYRINIDFATKKLDEVAKLTPGDPQRAKEQTEFKGFVEKHELDKTTAAKYNDVMNPALGTASGLIQSVYTYRKAKDTPFFDSESSKAAESAIGWFAMYEVRLGLVIAEYKHLTGSSAESALNELYGYVGDQFRAVKLTVPDGAVVDTRTNKMWTQNWGSNPEPANTFFRLDYKGEQWTAVYPVQGPVKLPGLDFENWALPSKSDFTNLIENRSPRTGTAFLKETARMGAVQVDAAGGKAFMAKPDGWKVTSEQKRFRGHLVINRVHLTIDRFEIANGQVDETKLSWCADSSCKSVGDREVGGVRGAVFYVRPLAKNESYTYG